MADEKAVDYSFIGQVDYKYGNTDGSINWPQSTEGDMIKEAYFEISELNFKVETSVARLDAQLCDDKRKMEDQLEIKRLNTIIHVAAGFISTTQDWCNKHPEDCLNWLLSFDKIKEPENES
jgi:hypothetical protein